jgi:1-acyl-sn-glycerol-3-phosphate acyltransferase
MFAIIIILFDVSFTLLGIYIFDYRVDGIINDIFAIILSFLVGLLVTTLFVGLILEIFYLSLEKGKQHKSMFVHKLAKQIVSVPIHFLRFRIKVIGKENLPHDPGFTIYANHSSWIDLPIVMYALYDNPVAALGKEGAFKIFAIGRFAPKLGCVMIHRKDPRQSAKAIRQVVNNVQNGFSMVIYPEGTRSPNVESVLDFKHGAFKVALRSKQPLVPVTIVKPKNYKKIKWPFIKRVTVVIHKPLLYDDFKEMKSIELSQRVKEVIVSSLGKTFASE